MCTNIFNQEFFTIDNQQSWVFAKFLFYSYVFIQILYINLIQTSHPEIRKNPVKPGRVFSGCKSGFEKTRVFFRVQNQEFQLEKNRVYSGFPGPEVRPDPVPTLFVTFL